VAPWSLLLLDTLFGNHPSKDKYFHPESDRHPVTRHPTAQAAAIVITAQPSAAPSNRFSTSTAVGAAED